MFMQNLDVLSVEDGIFLYEMVNFVSFLSLEKSGKTGEHRKNKGKLDFLLIFSIFVK